MELAKFTDSSGTEWIINLNVGILEDLIERVQVDLDTMMKKPAMLADLVLANAKGFVNMMYVLCEEQCKEREISDRQFGHKFDRVTLDAAADAFMAAAMLFFQRQSSGRVVAENWPLLLKKMDMDIEREAGKKIKSLLSS